MNLVSEPETRSVSEYEFLFTNGYREVISIDEAAGDIVAVGYENKVIFTLAERPSVNDPSQKIPKETIRIFLEHVLVSTKRQIKVPVVSKLDRERFHEQMKELAGR